MTLTHLIHLLHALLAPDVTAREFTDEKERRAERDDGAPEEEEGEEERRGGVLEWAPPADAPADATRDRGSSSSCSHAGASGRRWSSASPDVAI